MKITFTTSKTIMLKGSKCTVQNSQETLTYHSKESSFIFTRWSTTDGGENYEILPGTHRFVGDSRDFERFCRRNWNPFDTPWVNVYFVELENATMACEWEDLSPTQEEIDTVYDDWPEHSTCSDADHMVS